MKKIQYMALAVAACFGLASCATDIETPQLAAPEGENYAAPTLAACADILVNSDNSSENVSFVCSPVDFGISVPVRYNLYFENGATELHVGTSYSPTITLTKAEINGFALNQFGAQPNSTVRIGAYVVAYAGESEICTNRSNSVSFGVTTFRAALRQYYICGVYNGWDAGAAPAIWETGGGTNIFAGMYQLTEDAANTPGFSGFKVLPVRAWNGDMGYDAFSSRSANITSSNDGNLMVPAGIWQLTVNIGAMSIDAVSISKFYVAGGWNGWGDSTPLVYDPSTNTWRSPIPLPAGDEFKVVYESNGSQTWLGDTKTLADNMPEGRTEAWEIGDGGNITAPAGDKYLVVYTDRTPYVIAYE